METPSKKPESSSLTHEEKLKDNVEEIKTYLTNFLQECSLMVKG